MSIRTLLVIALFSLSACGGSGSDKESTVSFTGKAADGYLVGANACLDKDGDGVCWYDLPVMTGEDGSFTISGVTPAQLSNHLIIVEAIQGQTVDKDTGQPVSKGYSLTAPVGYEFISPLTSLVQVEVEKGVSLAQAEGLIKQKLNTDKDLFTDYVAAKADSDLTITEQHEYDRIHKVAQVTARILADKSESLRQVAQTNFLSDDELRATINGQLSAQLSEISQQVDNSESFDPDLLAQNVAHLIDLNDENFTEKYEQLKLDRHSGVWGGYDRDQASAPQLCFTFSEEGLIKTVLTQTGLKESVEPFYINGAHNSLLVLGYSWGLMSDGTYAYGVGDSDLFIARNDSCIDELIVDDDSVTDSANLLSGIWGVYDRDQSQLPQRCLEFGSDGFLLVQKNLFNNEYLAGKYSLDAGLLSFSAGLEGNWIRQVGGSFVLEDLVGDSNLEISENSSCLSELIVDQDV